ncbi:M16 family metallopeptidase [Cesiribacter andamanensis]|uniref:Protease3 n=1 Tax=Cesiribacter andamanensis AMV16 TaxID=1279009 RepID=M7NC39_9BACT|nr:pitrilysin family protein [Cesiribacter andamanensis]EMR04731.1 protease3 [Cesiribacter andamanensis AMV16]
MFNYTFLSLLLLLVVGQQTAVGQAKGEVFPYKINQTQLPNGLNVVTVPYNSPGLAAFYIVVRVGSREEVEAGKSGFAHFFEHMMFRGTDQYSKEAYSNALKGIGASANANTWWDRTVYHMTGNAGMLDKMFELEADRFMNLKYSQADFKVEAGAVKGEYTKNYASPAMQLYEKTYDTAFENHTYKHTTIGFWDDVVDMPNQYEYSLEFYKRFYRPEYSTIIVVGDVTPERVNALAKQYFGQWERGDYQPQIPAEPEQTQTRYAHVQNPNFPPSLSLNFKGPAFSIDQKDKAALDLFAAIAFSQKSPIYKKLVVEEQKVRNIGAYGLDTRDPGLFSISTSLLKAEDMDYVKGEIERVIEQYKNQPADAKLLQEAKSRMRYSFAMDLDSPDNIANALSQVTWLTGNPADINRLFQLYEQVGPQDIQNAVRKYLVSQKLTIGTIAPAADSPFKS